MATANSIIAYPSNNHKMEALKAFMKALHIKFKETPISETISSLHNDSQLIHMAMVVSEKSFQEDWANEDDAHWESFINKK